MASSPTLKSISPTPNPNVNSIFFSSSNFNNITEPSSAHAISPSPSRSKNPTISITIDSAEDQGRKDVKRKEDIMGKKKVQSTRMSRLDNHIESKGRLSPSQYPPKYRYIGRRIFESDRDIIRRQQAMIAIQPMTGLQEIEYKRDLLRLKASRRKEAERLEGSSSSLGNLTQLKIPLKSNPSSRSPSPGGLVQGDFEISRKLANSTSQAIKVTKKIVKGAKSVPPALKKGKSKG